MYIRFETMSPGSRVQAIGVLCRDLLNTRVSNYEACHGAEGNTKCEAMQGTTGLDDSQCVLDGEALTCQIDDVQHV